LRQATRMLGWATTLTGMLVMALLVPIGYSMVDLFLFNQGIGFRGGEMSLDQDGLQVSMPFVVNNTGVFPMSNIKQSISVSDSSGTVITENEILIPVVPEGTHVQENQRLTLSIDDFLVEERSHFLVRDAEFRMDMSLSLTYAGLMTFSIDLPNTTIPWFAPFHDLSTDRPLVAMVHNSTHRRIRVQLSYENHLPLQVKGVRLVLLNEGDERLTEGVFDVVYPQLTSVVDEFDIFIPVDDIWRLSDEGIIQVTFMTPEREIGPVEIEYG